MKLKKFSLLLAILMVLSLVVIPFSVSAEGEVAQVGTTKYATFAEAVTALNANGGTLTLLADVEVADATIEISHANSIIDGNGKTITSAADNKPTFEVTAEGAVEFKNLTLSAVKGAGIRFSTVTNLTVTNCDITAYTWTLRSNDDGGSLTVNGGTYINTYGNTSAIMLDKGLTIRFAINNANMFSSGNAGLETSGTGTVSGCTMTAPGRPLLMKAGANVTVYSAHLRSTAKPNKPNNQTIQIANGSNTRDKSRLTIYDIYAEGANPCIGNATTNVEINIYGGTFITRAATEVVCAKANVYGGLFINYNKTEKNVAFTEDVTVEGGTAAFYALSDDTKDDTSVTTSEITVAQADFTMKDALGNELYCKRYGTIGTPAMQDGATIRLADGSNGIRFTSTISKATLDYVDALKDANSSVSYGTVIAPADYFDVLDAKLFWDESYVDGLDTATKAMLDERPAFTMASLIGKNEVAAWKELNKTYTFENIAATAAGTQANDDGSVTIQAALVNIQSFNYDRDFAAVSYVKFVKDGQDVYIYSIYDGAKNTANLKDVAAAAIASYNEWHAQGYEMFTAAELATLNTYAGTNS